MKTDPVPFPIIAPLVRRHAEDAAFYWSQHDGSASSPHLTLAELGRFSAMLAAHLEGLAVAGSDGWAQALAALERWKKPGEAFVCTCLALQAGNAAQLDELMAHVRARPDELLRGVISAFGWVPHAQAAAIIYAWSAPTSDPIRQAVALRASALLGAAATPSLAQPLALFLDSPDEHVRAAACRVAAAASAGDSLHDAALRAGLQDPSLAVRAEAAIALGGRPPLRANDDAEDAMVAAEALWQCVIVQVKLHNAATGWYRKQALRRLQRWVQLLARLIPIGNPNLAALINFMPARVALRFIAYHGDSAHLPYVIAQMRDPATARYAGWVWQTITGVGLRASALVLPEPHAGSDTPELGDARQDADLGLPVPDADAIAGHSSVRLAEGQQYLQGQVLNPVRALSLLKHAVQAERGIAAQYLLALPLSESGAPHVRLSIRAAAPLQIRSVDKLRDQFADSGTGA
ncbi:hypothetical protein [Massilia atriviolacea]|uniref:hypothetical protein n=1 Tax=Massilia atriviolacea TaxID=2495579 RepID=UPI0018E0B4CA|nr:hypothetical protein [Massilia atriviolacea]